MAKLEEIYRSIRVESYVPSHTSGLHGVVHVRPLPDQGIPTTLHVECSKDLVKNYPVGTVFEIKAKLTDREGKGNYLYSSYKWPFKVIV